MTSALEYEDISHTFGDRDVLRGISLDICKGEFVCLLGPSGCGKTTLLRLAAGLERLQHGTVRLGGTIAADAASHVDIAPEKRHVGMMFQDYALFPHLTVMENILFGVKKGDRKRIDWVQDRLAHFGLSHLTSIYPGTLSGGEQQRVALLRALAPHPQLLLLDEPFSALDKARRIEMREETADLIRGAGATTLMVTHDGEEAMFMADRIVVMNEGRIEQIGSADTLYMNPNSAFVASLFGHANRFCETVRNAAVETPVGTFDAKGRADGERVCVFIRPEGVVPLTDEEAGLDAFQAEVTSSHYLGIASHIHMQTIGCNSGSAVAFHAQRTGRFLPHIGTRVRYRVDPDHVFVFPDDGTESNR